MPETFELKAAFETSHIEPEAIPRAAKQTTENDPNNIIADYLTNKWPKTIFEKTKRKIIFNPKNPPLPDQRERVVIVQGSVTSFRKYDPVKDFLIKVFTSIIPQFG